MSVKLTRFVREFENRRMFVRFLPLNGKTEIRRTVGEQARRRGLTKKNTGEAKRKKLQKGRMSVRTGGWEVKKMTQLWSKHGGQDR